MKSKNRYAAYLSALYKDAYTEQQVVEHFSYLTNKDRGQATTSSNIRRKYQRRELGELVRRLDPALFEQGYKEWKG